MVSVVAKSDTGRRGERETGMSFGREIRHFFKFGAEKKQRRKKTEFDNVNEHGLIKTKKKEKYRKTNNITIEGIEILTRGGKSNS